MVYKERVALETELSLPGTTTLTKKDYLKKSSNNYNSLNKLRVNYNSLKVFDLRSAPKTVSEYREEFKTYHVKPEGKMVGRDQLGK